MIINLKNTKRSLLKISKVFGFNLVVIFIVLNVLGFFLANHYFNVLKARYENQIIPDRVIFSKLFINVQVAFRDLPQYSATYDTVSFYWNTPGRFQFSIFDANYVASNNKAGLRVQRLKEYSNKTPIAILGDSHAYGVGVENEETYASILANKGFPISLVACSSFGTAREFIKTEQLIERGIIDTPEVLVIHYCPNDMYENLTFVKSNYALRIKSEEFFDENYRLISGKATFTQVYEGLPIFMSIPLLSKGISNRITSLGNTSSFTYYSRQEENTKPLIITPESQSVLFDIVSYFLKKPSFSKVRSIQFMLAASPNYYTNNEIKEQESLIEDCIKLLSTNFPKQDFNALFLPELETEKYYFDVDDHTNKMGHKWYAEELEKRLVRDE